MSNTLAYYTRESFIKLGPELMANHSAVNYVIRQGYYFSVLLEKKKKTNYFDSIVFKLRVCKDSSGCTIVKAPHFRTAIAIIQQKS